ncbi:cache domain-containing sensor histidine kinase [Paenibacillus glufosinatiresistens]|uniref:cache domain-containing sensor histidine kinase n=1 Tax=Paenibacillus glufosinatiresistens TaxID=3070657 RepID=UPI00286D730E|nr:sensor histidine kinase [Paenibacillus sp. YX.27]
MKLRRKILFAIILLVFIPVILMGTVTYISFSNAMESKSSNFYWISLQETDRKLGFALGEISYVTNSAILQTPIQQALKQPGYALTYDRKQDINNLLINHAMVSSFSLFGKDRTIYQYNNASLSFADLKKQPWYEAMIRAEGRPVWSGPGENGSAASGQSVLIQARVVKDYYSLEDIGYLVVYVKPELLDQIMWEAATLKKGDILLVNRQGNIVFSKSGEHLGEQTAFPFLQSGYKREKDHYIDRYQNERSLITYLPSENADWYLTAITPMNLITAETAPIRNIAIALSLISLLSAFLFDHYFVRKLIASISGAVAGMKRVKQGIFLPIARPEPANDESDHLIDGFNRMSDQIQSLLQQVEAEQLRKKEAEMQALMAQINPHFIYNSLESINSMAVLHGNRDISRMVVSLGKLLRISISQNQELIPLGMEMEHVRHYLDIQKFRFEDKFSYSIAVEPELKTYMTQKLIVQPIVENALYHAIEPMESPGTIDISIRQAPGGDLLILIADNGPGFDLSALSEVWEKDKSGQKKYNDRGVGLRNVHDRLNLRFGPVYGIMICSSPGCGSVIRLRIPCVLP